MHSKRGPFRRTLSCGTEHGSDVSEALNVSLLSEVVVATVGLKGAQKMEG